MNCLTDIEIELFALRKDNFKGTLKTQKSHLETCSFCLERYRDVLLFYEGAADFLKKSHSPKEISLLKKLEASPKSNIHIAYPFFPKFGSQINPVSVMAAANALSPEAKIAENLGILATKDKDILIRIMKSATDGRIDLYLIAENEQKYRHVLVRMPFLQDEFTSDENGKVHLGHVVLPELEELTVVVQTPLAAFDLSAVNFEHEPIESQTEVVLTNEENDSIKCEFISVGLNYTLKVHLLKFRDVEENKLRVMVSRGRQVQNLVRAQKGIAVFQGLEPGGTVRIQVFD